MNRRVFVLRFVLVAVLSLAIVGLLLKPYTYVLGYVVSAGVNWRTPVTVSQSVVEGNWFNVTLKFVCEGRPMTIPAGWVVINLAAFAALVGATPGIGWRRASRALGIGCGIFFVWHVVQLSALLIAGVSMNLTRPAGVARLLATVSVVLPFFVWLFLTRPPQIFQYLGGQRGEDNVEQS